uniref:Uncharacterized protein n=1 Tax=Scleropages formosus TaxID=113540 RepID=A0A8C9T441_SCLFO
TGSSGPPSLTCSGPIEDRPDVGTEVMGAALICPGIWFMLLRPLELALDGCVNCGEDCWGDGHLFPLTFPCGQPFMSDEGWKGALA